MSDLNFHRHRQQQFDAVQLDPPLDPPRQSTTSHTLFAGWPLPADDGAGDSQLQVESQLKFGLQPYPLPPLSPLIPAVSSVGDAAAEFNRLSRKIRGRF